MARVAILSKEGRTGIVGESIDPDIPVVGVNDPNVGFKSFRYPNKKEARLGFDEVIEICLRNGWTLGYLGRRNSENGASWLRY